ncbi:MAG: outer membrane protein assembly factor BamC [Burkholderiales bacterium]|nr:outer membrane protein assembly factor BamC [Burkholderiales bacterium]
MRLRKVLIVLGCAAASLALVSCKNIELPTKKIDYKSTSQLPQLEIPPDLTRPSTDDRFVVPDINPKGSATFSAYSSDRSGQKQAVNSTVLPQQDNVRIERAGTQRWLVVRGEPDRIWPIVKDFWLETGFVVNVEIPEAGVMETDWAENRAKIDEGFGIRGLLGKALDSLYSTSERDKFRTRLERSPEHGLTEIYISHRGMEEVYTSASTDSRDTRWQPRPPNPDLEAEMLRRLMVRFGVQEDRAQAQLVAAQTPSRAKLSTSKNGAGMLALDEQFDRAWRRVGLALDRVGFTVEDRDRSKGLYFVRYIDPETDNKKTGDKGWLSKLKFWGSSDDKNRNEQYRILVKEVTAGAEVNVLNKDGVHEKSETSSRILTLLYEQLK